MNRTHSFYPMITGSIKTILALTPDAELRNFLNIITTYPNFETNEDSALVNALIEELSRQYNRWNKGGDNGK